MFDGLARGSRDLLEDEEAAIDDQVLLELELQYLHEIDDEDGS